MNTQNSISSQNRLLEKLAALPGRISRNFFLIATLDAQADKVHDVLQTCRQRALSLIKSSKTNLKKNSKATQNDIIPGITAGQYDALSKLHLVQRQLLQDKLYIENEATHWFDTARFLIAEHTAELERMKHLEKNLFTNSPRSRSALSSNVNLTFSNRSYSQCTSSRKINLARFSEVSTANNLDVSSHDERSIRSSMQNRKRATIIGSDFPSKRAMKRSDDSNKNLKHRNSKNLNHMSQLATKLPSNSSTQDNLLDNSVNFLKTDSLDFDTNQQHLPEGVIIKLRSQKGRPRKSNSKQFYASLNSSQNISDDSIFDLTKTTTLINSNLIDEYICPICNNSEHENPAMVACDNCDKWFHCVCVGFVDEADAASKVFYCPTCRTASIDSNSDLL